jgi:hypothetical protein
MDIYHRKGFSSHAASKSPTLRWAFSSSLAWMLMGIGVTVLGYIGHYAASTEAIVCSA